jgi:IS30 family transposase
MRRKHRANSPPVAPAPASCSANRETQFFPKKMAFESITPSDIEFATHRLNHLPRKWLGFKTAPDAFL